MRLVSRLQGRGRHSGEPLRPGAEGCCRRVYRPHLGISAERNGRAPAVDPTLRPRSAGPCASVDAQYVTLLVSTGGMSTVSMTCTMPLLAMMSAFTTFASLTRTPERASMFSD